jgi:hypothetical protein
MSAEVMAEDMFKWVLGRLGFDKATVYKWARAYHYLGMAPKYVAKDGLKIKLIDISGFDKDSLHDCTKWR